MTASPQDYLWCERFRPHLVADTVLPPELKATFQKFVDDRNVPNLLLTGPAGVGKTTIARAMLEEIGSDYIIVNGSLNGNIDTLRSEIMNFASSVSFTDGRKYVILDEADYLNAQSTQPALRNFMEEYSRNAGFILTCNYPAKIIKELHSRCSVVSFKIPKADKPAMAKEFMGRVVSSLKEAGCEYDARAVAQVVQRHFPDFRRTFNELQRYAAATGRIDAGIVAEADDVSLKELFELMRAKKYSAIRKWIAENVDMDQAVLYRKIYDSASSVFQPDSIPQLVLILADYQYKAAFAVDVEINVAACLAEIMVTAEFAA